MRQLLNFFGIFEVFTQLIFSYRSYDYLKVEKQKTAQKDVEKIIDCNYNLEYGV